MRNYVITGISAFLTYLFLSPIVLSESEIKITYPPVVIKSAITKCSVDKEVAQLRVKYGLEVNTKTDVTIMGMRGKGVLIRLPDDKNVKVIKKIDEYALVVNQIGRRDIALEFLVPVEDVNGRKQIRFGLARSLISELEFEISGTALDIDIKGAVGKTVKEEEGKTIVKANISNPEDIEVSWRPKPPSIEKMEAVIFADTAGVLRISGGVISQSSHIKLTPVQGMIEKIEFGLPEGFSLLGVKGENIKEWKEVEREGNRKEIIVELHRKEDKGYELLVETQKQLGVLPDEIDADGIELTGVKQERGYLGVVVGEELQLEDIRVEGLSQIESERMPNTNVGQGERLVAAYRYITSGYKITGRVNQLKAEVEVESRQTIAVGESSIEHSYRGRYKIEKAGIFGLSVWIPEGYTVTEVRGKEIADWKEKEEEKIDEETVSRHYVDITLNRKVTGEYEIEVRLEKSLKELEKVVALHGAASRGVKKEAGYIAVASDAGVRLKTGRMENLREVAVGEITGGERGVISLAYRYLKVPWALEIETEEVIPVVTAEVFHLVTIGEGYMAGSVTSIYQIEMAPTKEFEFKVPAELKNVEITGENIRRKEIVGQENNKDIWSVTLQDKVMGAYSLVLTYDYQEPGGSYRLKVPEIEVGKVERESGYIGLGRRANIEIKEVGSSLAGVDSIDTKEIPVEYMRLVKVPVVSGYKYWRHPYKVEAEIGKYEDVGILQAIVDRAQITTVVAEDGQLISQASYMVKNNSQQYMKVVLPEGSELWSSFVSGRAVKAARADNGILIPLERPESSNEPFPVELIYAKPEGKKMKGIGSFRLSIPVLDTCVAFHDWGLYLPAGYEYVRFSSDMVKTKEQVRNVWHQTITIADRIWQRHAGLIILFSIIVMIALLWVFTSGVEKTRRINLPSSLISTLVIIAIIAVLAAVLLPTLSTSRESARMSSCVSNLHQVGLALHQFAMDHQGKFPNSLEELLINYLSGARKVFICPSSTDTVESGAISYVYIPGLSEQASPDTVVAYCKWGNHKEDGTNVLYLDGSTRWARTRPPVAVAEVSLKRESLGAGFLPVKIEIPKEGEYFRFTKLLSVHPGEELTVVGTFVKKRIFMSLKFLCLALLILVSIYLIISGIKKNRLKIGIGILIGAVAVGRILYFAGIIPAIIICIPLVLIIVLFVIGIRRRIRLKKLAQHREDFSAAGREPLKREDEKGPGSTPEGLK